ncbi:MAG: hypothetical protein Q9191_006670 [Dirinaria sp. TL-2023a]
MAGLAFLSNPKILYYTRCVQILFSVAFLVLICYSGTHRGWWNNINPALAVGVITCLFTYFVAAHTIFTHHRSNPFSGRGSVYTIVRLVVEVLVFLLWVATAALMLRHKGGCENNATVDGGKEQCTADDGKHWKYHDDQPVAQWDVAVAFDLVMCVTFLVSILLVFKDNRANKVSEGGTSYA